MTTATISETSTAVERYSYYILNQLRRDAQRARDAADVARDSVTDRVSSEHFDGTFIDSDLRSRTHNLGVAQALQYILDGAESSSAAEFVEQLGSYYNDMQNRLADSARWLRDGREQRSNGAGEAVCGFIRDAERGAWGYVVSNDPDYRAAQAEYSKCQSKRNETAGKLDRARNEERKAELQKTYDALVSVEQNLKESVVLRAQWAEEQLGRSFRRVTAPSSYADIWTR